MSIFAGVTASGSTKGPSPSPSPTTPTGGAVDPIAQALFSQFSGQPLGAAAAREPRSIQQLIARAIRQTGGGFANSGLLPQNRLQQIFKGAQTGLLEPASMLVYFGDAPSGKAPGVVQGQNLEGTTDSQGYALSGESTPGGDEILTVAQAVNMPYMWSDEEVREAIKKFQQAGIEIRDMSDLASKWGTLVEHAANTYTLSNGNRKVTPWDVLDLYKKDGGVFGEGSGSESYTGTKTQVTKSINDLTDGQAWSVLRSNLQSLLGRDPSDDEIRDFTYKMGQLAARNPQITRTIAEYEEGELVSSTSRTRGGFTADDAAMEAYDQAQNDPEYAEYQAATTYFSALEQALGAIGG